MNDKDRKRYLKLRQRADRLETELINEREERRREYERLAADLRSAHSRLGAISQKATLDAQNVRQSDNRQKTYVERLLRILDAVAPRRELISQRPEPAGWREIVQSESMWADWLRVQQVHGGPQDRRDMQMKLDPTAGTVSWAAAGSGGAGGGPAVQPLLNKLRTQDERRDDVAGAPD